MQAAEQERLAVINKIVARCQKAHKHGIAEAHRCFNNSYDPVERGMPYGETSAALEYFEHGFWQTWEQLRNTSH